MTKQHLVVYGHGAGDPGALGNGYTEANFTRYTLGASLEKYAKQLKNSSIVFYDKSINMYASGTATSVKKYDSVTEWHLDASENISATGGHVIVNSNFSADANDLAIAKVLEKYVGWWGSVQPTKGINYRNDLYNLRVFADRGISYRLVELGFITNSKDVNNLVQNIDSVAKEMVEAITGEKLGKTAPAKPANKPSSNSNSKGHEWAEAGKFRLNTDGVALRLGHTTNSKLIARLNSGDVVRYDKAYKEPNGYVWIRQTPKRAEGWAWIATGATDGKNNRKNYWGSFSS